MPEIDSGSAMPTMSLKIGETIKNATPSSEAPLRIEEKTSTAQTNTQSEIQSEAAQAASQENIEDFVSGAAKARKLGESRRKLAKSILDGAAMSTDARDNFRKLVQGDKDLDKYFQKHFPFQYKAAFSEAEVAKGLDTEQSTRAKILAEEIQIDKKEASLDLAIHLKFSESEAEELEEMASKLEGTKVGGKELDYDAALIRAARIIRPDKAKAGITVLPSSRGLDDTKTLQTQAKNEELVDKTRSITGYKPDRDQMLRNFDIVNEGYDSKNRKFVMPEQHM